MSYRVSRRALVPTAVALAIATGPVAVLAPLSANAVTLPTQADVTLANPADALAFDDGRLLTNSGPGSSRSVGVDSVTTPLGQVTIATDAVTYASSPPNTPDRRTFATSAGVDLVASSATGRVVAKRGTTTLLNVPAPAGSAWSVDLSGPYARVGQSIYDLRVGTNAVYTLPTRTANVASYGSRVVWSENDGSVRYRDVATSKAPAVLRAGATQCTTCAFQVATNGTTVAFGVAGGALSLWDTGTGIGRANVLSLTDVERIRVAEGLLATTKTSGITLYRLNDPLTISTPTPYLTGTHVVDLAVDGHTFAYLRADGSATVAQLPDAVDGERRPMVLAASVPGAFSPNGDNVKDVWTPSFVLTQPVSAWQLQVIDPATNSPIATVNPPVGSLPAASIAANWGASAGRKQGSYKWTLTASNVDGAAVSATGTTINGVVNLRRKNERTTGLAAPANVATSTRSLRTPVFWRAAGAFPAGVSASRWDVQVRVVRIARGKRVYGRAAAVLNRTTKKSTTYAGKQGMTYQFRARSKDSVGLTGPWSRWATSNTPLDDRSKSLRYSSGWSAKRAVGPWGGTHRVTSKANRTMTVTNTATSGFALVFRTCPTCGSVKIYVDGKLKKKVSLSGASALRKQKYSVSFKKLGKHSLRIVTVAKGKKKTVALDAVLIKH